jgi:ketosteroid isomerase-like protein
VPSVLAEEVRAQVHRFWNAFSSKAGDVMESMYFPAATVFGPSGPHSETARLTLARRLRQFAEEKSSRSAHVGNIEVRIMDDVAIASYSYDFRLSSIGKNGGRVDINVPFSGATQVFLRDKSGALRIAHEHLSKAEPGKKTQLGPQGSSLAEALMPRPSASSAAGISGGGSLPPTDALCAEQIRGEVKKLWQLFVSKNKEGVERMYAPTAIAWPIGAKRGLPASLVLAAKAREILGPQSAVIASLGSIDVQALSKNVVLASYSFHYGFVRVQGYGKRADTDMPFQGKRFSFDCPFSRGTHVFERNDAGAIQIVHEHVSTAEIPIYKELPVSHDETARVL